MVICEHLELPSDVVERRHCRNKSGEKRIKQINKMKRRKNEQQTCKYYKLA